MMRVSSVAPPLSTTMFTRERPMPPAASADWGPAPKMA